MFTCQNRYYLILSCCSKTPMILDWLTNGRWYKMCLIRNLVFELTKARILLREKTTTFLKWPCFWNFYPLLVIRLKSLSTVSLYIARFVTYNLYLLFMKLKLSIMIYYHIGSQCWPTSTAKPKAEKPIHNRTVFVTNRACCILCGYTRWNFPGKFRNWTKFWVFIHC